MQQSPNDSSQPQWKKLTTDIKGEKPPASEYIKLLSSQDHLILLTSEEGVIYTFHLKDLSWTKHNIDRRSTRSMSSNSCMARPGLIVDLDYWLSGALELLTFDTEKVPTNFCQTSKGLANSSSFSIAKVQGFPFTADSKSIYIFGGKEKKQYETIYLNTIYRVDLESFRVDTLGTNGPGPSERYEHLASSFNDKLFIHGGKDRNGYSLSDLWVLNLSEKTWKKLDGLKHSLPKEPSFLLAQERQVLMSGDGSNGNFSILSYNLYDSSWRIINSNTPKHWKKNFAVYGNSIMFLESSELYSLNISDKIKICSEKQPGDFMAQVFQDKTFADVIFQVGDHEFPANKCLLSVRCPYFKNVFMSNMMESHNKTIKIEDERPEVFKVLLEYLYFQEIDVECEMAEDLFKLAHKYRLQNLQNDCEELLTKDIQVENVIKKIHFAKVYETNRLRKACLAFIARNPDPVYLTQNIHELDKETLLELHKMKA